MRKPSLDLSCPFSHPTAPANEMAAASLTHPLCPRSPLPIGRFSWGRPQLPHILKMLPLPRAAAKTHPTTRKVICCLINPSLCGICEVRNDDEPASPRSETPLSPTPQTEGRLMVAGGQATQT